MKKNLAALILLIACSMFTVSAYATEKIIIPRNGILENAVEIDDKEIVVYRDDVVIVSANKATRISTDGCFLMTVYVFPTEISKKNQGWFDYVNGICSAWSTNNHRISASPTRIDGITYYVKVDETNATCKIYGVKMYDYENGSSIKIFDVMESKKNTFTAPFEPLERSIHFDAAYRKLIQWHKEH